VDRREFIAAAGSVTAVASASRAFARMGGAFLDHAVPGVGLTVSDSPRELRLYFTQGVVTAFSSVQVTSSTGARVPASRPVNDPSDQQIVIVRLGLYGELASGLGLWASDLGHIPLYGLLSQSHALFMKIGQFRDRAQGARQMSQSEFVFRPHVENGDRPGAHSLQQSFARHGLHSVAIMKIAAHEPFNLGHVALSEPA
jgi:methionine-rich copper-binding protein CopC